MPGWLTALNLNGWSIAGLVITVVVTWLLAWLARKGVSRVIGRVPNLSEGIKTLAVRLTGYAIWLVGIGVALSFVGASIQPVLAAAVVVGIVLVLVLRGIADNFASGVVLQTRRPFGVGDLIQSGDFEGEVRELNGRSVVIRTGDGRTVHIPNSAILREPLVHHSEHGGKRSAIDVRITRAKRDPDFRAILEHATHSVDGVLQRQPVTALPYARGVDVDAFIVQYWHHPTRTADVTAAVVDAVADALTEQELVFQVSSAPATAVRVELPKQS
jgi:small conductance mechanosensitive channel